MEQTNYCIVQTSCKDRSQAKRIIDKLLGEKAAACIQTKEIESSYIWKGQVETDSEILLWIKSKKELYKKIEKIILENHSYDIPEIIQIPVTQGYEKYLEWMDEVCES